MVNSQNLLNEKNDVLGKDKPPDDKGESQKPPDDKSITQEIIRRSIKNGDIQVVAQLEILENGSTIITVYQERKKKKKEEGEQQNGAK